VISGVICCPYLVHDWSNHFNLASLLEKRDEIILFNSFTIYTVYYIKQNYLIVYNKDKYEIKIYATENGNEPFREWLDSLKDFDTQALIFQRLQRIKLGNFGDCKPIDEGLWEFRIHHSRY
jgi:hypothetical protein